jgi:hypothetical protein
MCFLLFLGLDQFENEQCQKIRQETKGNTFDFSILYTIIPHTLLKSNIKELIQRCFSQKNGEQRDQYLVIGRDKSYFVKSISKSNNKYKYDVIIQMLDIFNWQHICPVWWTGVSINDWYSMGTGCAQRTINKYTSLLLYTRFFQILLESSI